MHRVLPFLLLTLIALGAAPSGRAHEATDAPVAAELAGYPELLLRLSETGVEVPDRVTAGRTLVIQENLGPEDAHLFLLRVPDDVSETDLVADLAIERRTMADETPEWL